MLGIPSILLDNNLLPNLTFKKTYYNLPYLQEHCSVWKLPPWLMQIQQDYTDALHGQSLAKPKAKEASTPGHQRLLASSTPLDLPCAFQPDGGAALGVIAQSLNGPIGSASDTCADGHPATAFAALRVAPRL